jgi:hypothetical protein
MVPALRIPPSILPFREDLLRPRAAPGFNCGLTILIFIDTYRAIPKDGLHGKLPTVPLMGTGQRSSRCSVAYWGLPFLLMNEKKESDWYSFS